MRGFHHKIEPVRGRDSRDHLVERIEQEKQQQGKAWHGSAKDADTDRHQEDDGSLGDTGNHDPGLPVRFHRHVVRGHDLGEEVQEIVHHRQGADGNVTAPEALDEGGKHNLEIQQGKAREIECALDEVVPEIR